MSRLSSTSDPGTTDCERLLAESEAKHQRALKVQSALFRIAEAAASTEGLSEFYAAVHAIVGELMYAKNFFIAIYDEKTGMLTWPYYVDTSGLPAPDPTPRERFKGGTTYVLDQGMIVHAPRAVAEEVARSGAITMEDAGNVAEDWLGVPLRVEGQTVGVLVVQSYEQGIGYTDSDVEVLNFVAQHIASALMRARAIEETRQRSAELTIINTVQEGLARKLELQEIVDLVGTEVNTIFDADTVHVRLYDAERDWVHHDYYVDRGERIPFPERNQPRPSLGALLIDERKPLLLGTSEEGGRLGAAPIPRQDGQDLNESYLGVPLLTQGKVVGAISVQSYRQHAYDQDDLRLLQTVAQAMSVALENARLFDELQHRNAEIQGALERQTATSEILSVIASSPADVQPVLDAVAERAARLCNSYDAAVFRVDADVYRSVAHWGPVAIGGRGEEPLDRQTVSGVAMLERRTLHIHDVRAEPEGLYPLSKQYSREGDGQRTMLVAPLIREGTAIGAIVLRRTEVNPFTETQIALLQTFADQAAIAIENVRLFSEVQQRNSELAIINSVQEGLAKQLEIQGIVDLVGEKVGEIFQADTTVVVLYDVARDWASHAYYVDRGLRTSLPDGPAPKEGLFRTVVNTSKPLLLGTKDESAKLGAISISSAGTEEDLNESYLGVPILADQQVIGVMAVQSYRQHAYGQDHLRLLQTLANAASVSMKNADLFDQVKQRNSELAIINSVQEGLARKLDIQSIVDLIGQKVGTIFAADTTVVGLYDPTTDRYSNMYYVDRGRRTDFPDGPARRPSLGAAVIDKKQPLLLRSKQEMEALGSLPVPSTEAGQDLNESFLGVPILAAKGAIGWMMVESYKPDAYDEDDLRLLQTLAHAVSAALENARLFDETQRLLKETEERAAELQIINSVQQGLASKLEMQAIYDLLGEKIREVFDAQGVGINSYDRTAGLIHRHYLIERGERHFPPPAPITDVTKRWMAIREPLLINENWRHRMEELGLGTALVPGTDAPMSFLLAPLMVADEVRGTIGLENMEREHAFSESDVRLLTTLSSSVSVALENARLFDEVNQRNSELAVITSVQEGLARKLDFQGIVDLIGKQVGEIFSADTTAVALYESGRDWRRNAYYVDRGERAELPDGPLPRPSLFARMLDSGQPLLLGSAQETQALGAYQLPSAGTDQDLNESFLGVPILAENRAIGVIAVQSYRRNAYGADDLRLLQTLASSVSVALENARLFDETQRLLKETEQRAAELQIINTVQAGLASKLDMQAVYELVGDQIRDIFRAQSVSIGAIDPRTAEVEWKYGWELGKRIPDTLEAATDLSRNLLKSQGPLVFNTNAGEELGKLGGVVMEGTEPPRSAVFVPLLVGQQVSGFVTLQNMDRENAFAESDIRLLQTLASSMSVALENARLFDETQRLLKETEERAAELQIINSVQQGLASKLEMQAIYDLVGDKIREVFSAQAVLIQTYNEAAGTVQRHYGVERGQRFPNAKFAMNELHRNIIRRRDVTLFNQNAEEELEALGATLVPGSEPVRSAVFAPLLAGERVFGSISLQDVDREHAYSPADVRLLETLANSMSVALENARLFDETQRLLKETEERNAELAVINAVQQALAAKLDMQAVFDVVGEKLHEVFPDAQVVDLLTYHRGSEMFQPRFVLEKGQRLQVEPWKAHGLRKQVVETARPLMINRDFGARMVESGHTIVAGEQAKSWLGVPMVLKGEVTGVISLQHMDREDAFRDSDVRLLQTISGSMSVALENARLFDETQRLLKETEERNAELAIINSVQAALASELQIEGVYQAVGDKVREIFHQADVGIRIYDSATNLIHFPYVYEAGQRISIAPRALSEGGLTRFVLDSRMPLAVTTAAEFEARFGHQVIPGTRAEKSAIYSPLLVGDRARGLLEIVDYEHEHAFRDSDVRLLQTLANSMSVALENARLFDETQRLLRETEQRNAELAIITSVQAALAAELSILGIYEAVGDKIREIFRNTDMNIRIYDAKTNLVHYPYLYENGERLSIEPSALTDTGFDAHVLRSRQTLVVNENMAEAMTKYGSAVLPGTTAEKSAIYVPLIAGDRARGLISLANMEREHAFSDSDVRLLQTLANSMSVALENARLFDETQRLLKETEQRNNELAIITSVQEGLASKLEMQAIYEIVGDKIREVFRTESLTIMTYEPSANLRHRRYIVEDGHRIQLEPGTMNEFDRYLIRSGQTVLANRNASEELMKLGATLIPGTAPSLSTLMVPLLAGKTVFGYISLESSDREDAFSQADVRLLETLANSMSVALENARLFDETQRLLKETEQRNNELAIITGVQEGLASKLEMQAIYELVGEQIRQIFDTQVVDIALFDRRANQLHFPYSIERGVRLPDEPLAVIGFRKHVIETAQPLIINEGMNEMAARHGNPLAIIGEPPKSALFVPMIAAGEVKGVISLQNLDREGVFTDADLRLLQHLSNSMSVALENARLFDETQRLLKETEDRASELSIINSVQRGLASKLEMQAVYDLVGDKIRDILQTEVVYIAVRDSGDPELIRFPYYVDRGKRLEQTPVALGEGITSKVMEARGALVAGTMEEQVTLGGIYDSEERSQSYLGVPIFLGEKVMGVVSVQSYAQHAFGDTDVRLLSTLASSMGVALENARLFDETQRLLKETEERNAELAIINSVQGALSQNLDIAAIYNVVGDKIREIFEAQAVLIVSYEEAADLMRPRYILEKGQRYFPGPAPLNNLHKYLIRRREALAFSENAGRRMDELGAATIAGTEEVRSAVFAPLLSGERVFGTISLQNVDREHAFSDSDVRLLQTLAGSMSVALENARLFDETQRLLKETEERAAELGAINTVSEALVSESELDALIQLIGGQIRELFNADIAYLALLDPQTQMINFPYIHGDEELRPLRLGEGWTSKIIETREPLLLNQDLDGAARRIGAKRVGSSARSYLGVPIIVEKQAIGALSVQSTREEGRFSENDVRLLGTIAANAGAAIRNAQLFAETQRRAREMATLAEIGSDIAATRELEPILERIAAHAGGILNVADLAIFLLDPDEHTLRVPVAIGRNSDELKAEVISIDQGVTGAIARSAAAEVVNYPHLDPRVRHVTGTPEEEDPHQAYMAAPLISRGRTIGVIGVWREHVNGLFTQSDLDFLVGVARQTAIAIESARLYLETQRRAREMGALVEVGREISASLDAPTVLQGIARHARDLLNAATSAVFLPEAGGQSFRAIAAVGLDADQTRNYTVKLGSGILGDIAQRKVGEILNNTAADKRTIVIPGTEPVPDEHMLAVPLLADKEIQGLMAVWRRGKGTEFATEDLEFLNGLSRQAVIAIQNARLFDEVGRQRQYYEGIVQNSPVAIVTLDDGDSIVSWNPAAERLFGFAQQEAIGQNIDDLVANNPAVRAEAESRNQQAREGFVRVITKRTRKDGSLVDVALAGVSLRLADGRPGSVAIYNDITELQHARQEAVAANEAKSSFLATMSHELRTPMNAVIGMSGLLMDTELSNEQRDYADTIRNSGDALLAIINDILDFSKIEAGRMEVESQPFDLRECLESALDLTSGRAVEKGLDMAYIMDDDVPAGIKGDVTRLRQILINLLSNAVKFTQKGEVVLSVKKGIAEDELLFTVRDTGMGISENQMNRLFQSFSQADSSTTRRFGGTGLGLAISRRLAEMMGGEMHAHSEGPGKGSIFLFTIRAKPAKVAARKAVRVVKGVQEALQGKRALIVDDNETNRRILMIQTAKWGMSARETASPRDALRWLKDGERFDVVLTDMHMPDLDGLMFSREIRKLKEKKAIPIVLMSSLGRREAGAEEMDFAAYLTKPLKPSALYDTLAGIFARHLVAPRVERGRLVIDSELAARHPLRILLAEDNQVNQKLALRILEQMGYRADVASNGLEAVESIERQAYDVILMDVQMPDMDGLEATRTIRNLAEVTQPRIIAMTANAMEGDREMCLAAGMDDYVSKPVRVNELVDALLKAKRG